MATTTLSPSEISEVEAIAAAATAADGVGPLDDQVRTELAFGLSPGARHVVARTTDRPAIVGYSHLVSEGAGASAHLVVHPEHRRHGLGAALVDFLLAQLDPTPTPISTPGPAAEPDTLRVWAHGDLPAAQALAAARGFERVRELWQMRRSLAEALPAPTYPDDVVVRTFEPGVDDEAWVALNAAAFKNHPEQGRLTVADLRHRIDQPWFDAAGFFLAERQGELVGSHWTKVHPAEETGDQPVGEVYAVGVHPSAQGLGLGKALTLTGLRHLQDAGLAEAMLYVDGDNTAATGLYERLGFKTTTVDVMYASPPDGLDG